MLIRRRDSVDIAHHNWWSCVFPDAERVTLEGTDLAVPAVDAGLVAETMAAFITGSRIEPTAQRHLVAVLFTDLVDSTPAAAETGDALWRSCLDRHEAALNRTIERHHGTLIKHTGDGALATFPTGSQALAAGVELRNGNQDLGLDSRTGIHVGEIERRGHDIGGIAVHLTARVMNEAGPGEILVTSTVTDASIGSAFRFNALGARNLEGIDQPWHLAALDTRPR